MVGVKGRSGRRPGSISYHKNPTAWAGHHFKVLIEMWLAGVSIRVAPDKQLLGPTKHRHTVPPRIKRVLAEFAIGHILEQDAEARKTDAKRGAPMKRPDSHAVIEWARRRAPNHTLRHQRRKAK